MPIIGKIALHLRYLCAKRLFARCDGFVNLEHGAYIGNGKNFFVGKNVGIGKDFVCHSRIVTIHDGLLMAENVLFQGGALLRGSRQTYWFRNRQRTNTIGDLW